MKHDRRIRRKRRGKSGYAMHTPSITTGMPFVLAAFMISAVHSHKKGSLPSPGPTTNA
jgi:hypothetical protein